MGVILHSNFRLVEILLDSAPGAPFQVTIAIVLYLAYALAYAWIYRSIVLWHRNAT